MRFFDALQTELQSVAPPAEKMERINRFTKWLLSAIMALFAYCSFYPTQLVGPFNWPIFVLALFLAMALFWRLIVGGYLKHSTPLEMSAVVPGFVWFALFVAGIWTLLLGGLDVVEHVINRTEWGVKAYPITDVEGPRKGRFSNTHEIEFDIEGQFFSAGISVPRGQMMEMRDLGYAGLCVQIKSRPAILMKEQILTGCHSMVCSPDRATIINCPDT